MQVLPEMNPPTAVSAPVVCRLHECDGGSDNRVIPATPVVWLTDRRDLDTRRAHVLSDCVGWRTLVVSLAGGFDLHELGAYRQS